VGKKEIYSFREKVGGSSPRSSSGAKEKKGESKNFHRLGANAMGDDLGNGTRGVERNGGGRGVGLKET